MWSYSSPRQRVPVDNEGLEKKAKKKRVVSKAFISDSDEEMNSDKEGSPMDHLQENVTQQHSGSEEE